MCVKKGGGGVRRALVCAYVTPYTRMCNTQKESERVREQASERARERERERE